MSDGPFSSRIIGVCWGLVLVFNVLLFLLLLLLCSQTFSLFIQGPSPLCSFTTAYQQWLVSGSLSRRLKGRNRKRSENVFSVSSWCHISGCPALGLIPVTSSLYWGALLQWYILPCSFNPRDGSSLAQWSQALKLPFISLILQTPLKKAFHCGPFMFTSGVKILFSARILSDIHF